MRALVRRRRALKVGMLLSCKFKVWKVGWEDEWEDGREDRCEDGWNLLQVTTWLVHVERNAA